ncbi:HIT family protein [Salinivibrio sharmensis]|uniref:HIT family protein n=1 Tax=Salinivibrio sharmensis TaxID=390883 RepID=A0ABX3KKN1_9GAMM|nr:HIT domain-containing protein [Salinivibrio sharmensis]OOE90787.1 HIT family protein [Salinivibrio sharmensis]
MSFTLHPRLADDSAYVGDFPLCQLRLAHADIGPWLLLVPRKHAVQEIHHLDDSEQQSLWQESAMVARCLERLFSPDKLNIAAIGNLVPQLHVHHVARFQTDPVWPNPIWGHLQVGQRTNQQEGGIVLQIREELAPKGLKVEA